MKFVIFRINLFILLSIFLEINFPLRLCAQDCSEEKCKIHHDCICNCENVSTKKCLTLHQSKLKAVLKCVKNTDWNWNINSAYIYDTPTSLTHKAGLGFARTSMPSGVFKTSTLLLEFGIGTNNFLKGVPVYIGIKPGTELTVIQRFDSYKKASFAKPFNLFQIPINAELAEKILNPGDIVRFVAYLNLNLGVQSYSYLIPPTLLAGIKGEVILSGFFKIEMQKLTKNRIRMRVSTWNAKSANLSAGAGITHAITTISPIDNILRNNVIYLNLVDTQVSTGLEKKYFLDYVFNLNNDEAKEAFNQILSSPLRFIKDLPHNFKSIIKKFKNQSKDSKGIFHDYISSTSHADDLAYEDSKNNKSLEDFRIRKLFNGNINNFYNTQYLNISYGIGHHINSQTYNKKNIDLEIIDHSLDEWKNFYNPFFSRIKLNEFSLGIFKRLAVFNFPAVFESNPDKTYKFNSFGMFHIRRNHFFFFKELNKLRKLLIRSLSPEIFNQTQWIDEVNLKDKNKLHGPHNGLFLCIITFKKKSLEYLKNYSKQDLYTLLDDYLREMKSLHVIPKLRTYRIPKVETVHRRFFVKKLYSLIQADSDAFTPKEVEEFMQLRHSILFRDLGSGFLMRLLSLNNAPLVDTVNIFIGMMGFDYTPHFIQLGSSQGSELYNKLLQPNLDLMLLPYDYEQIDY